MTDVQPSKSSKSSKSSKANPQDAARIYLHSLISKTLRIHTTDERMFLGEFKCTDSDLNIILSHTYEYRFPAPPSASELSSSQSAIKKDLTSRYLGLVVVPGEYIRKIELEEFESQVRGREHAGK
ncbi:lsm domain-containing protein [Rutstroemia sp. NJR-2017a WRK4]|nr:lsm domain-containing protein [Rutstroemia sp. NJR-2017a WRK4]